MKVPEVCLALIALAAVLCCGGCGDEPAASTGASGATKVSLQLNWRPEPQFGGFYAAKEAGLFKEQGLDVEITEGGVGTPTVQMVGTGKVDFGIVSADELLIARSKGNDVVALFAAYQIDPHGIMVHASRGFKEIGDVFRNEGTVAMQRGYPYAMFLEKKYGFDKVKVVPSPGGDVSGFLRDKNFAQQCFVTSEPLVARKAGADPKAFNIADAGYNPYTTVVAARGDFVRKHPQTVRAFALACRKGWEAYLNDPKPTNVVINRLNPSMDPETLVASAEAQVPLIRTAETESGGLGSMTLDRWRTLGQQLHDLGMLDKVPPPEECFVDPEKLPANPQ